MPLLHNYHVTKFDVSLQVVDRGKYISGSLGLTVAAMLFVLSCAKISAPTGGPKDNDPPVILKSLPENGTVMFSGKTFSITFDEYVVLDRITEKFMVSPPLATKPDIKLRGKNLVVTWEDDLADSTTYTFYFQDAIRDNNENNPIPNYQYVFSTGPFLDSLSLTGNVFNASDLEIVEDVTVIMHSNLSDTAPRKVLPAYISRPDPSGGFMISNIRPGNYRLYALKDMNGNTLYDLDDEIFAFSDSLIRITPENYFGMLPDTVTYRPAAAPETTKPDKFVFGLHRLYAFQQTLK
ncbi:MAG: Ig-like domain-containing domain [Bacteroidales bacterium]